VVEVPRLVQAAWDDDPPAAAGRQVRNRVAALRAILTRFGGLIDTEADGYRLRALAIHRATGHRTGEGRTLRLLANAHPDAATASEYAEQAAGCFAEPGVPP
jgi:hypothetical protein